MDKNVFAAVILCAAIFMGWQHFYMKPITEKQQLEARVKAVAAADKAAAEATSASSASPSSSNPKTSTLSSKRSNSVPISSIRLSSTESAFSATLSTEGGKVLSLDMGPYRGKKAEMVQSLVGGGQQLELSIPGTEWATLSNSVYQIEKQTADSVVLLFEDERVQVRRTYTLRPERYSLDHEIDVKFKMNAPQFVFVGAQVTQDIPKALSENEKRELFYNKTSKQTTWAVGDVKEAKEDIVEGSWLGFSSRYFLKALVDRGSASKPQFQAKPIDGGLVSASLIYKPSNSGLKATHSLYFGPKDVDILKKVGSKLDMAVDFGWFTFFAYPLLEMLKWLYKFIHNFGIAIILLTIFVKLLTYPLTYKSMKSMKDMQKIQPQIQKLRDRYKDDKEALNKEMLSLMRTNGYNPMSGCLPIFIQMPVFIALYNVLYGAIDLYGMPFFGWITDLSAKDPYFVTPVLLGALMFLQQKLTPSTATDPAQQKMLMLMPVIFSVMMLWLPSGLTLYMLVNSLASIVQQLIINKKLNLKPAVVTG